MATASLAPRPQQIAPMASRRAPLASNPNAANSPFRNVSALKRSRPAPTDRDREHENLQSPPKKKQAIEVVNGVRRVQNISFDEREGRVFLGQSENTTPNAFQKRLAATREGKQGQPKAIPKPEKQTHADAETVKQWRRHYRKVFPSFVFYFESLPPDVCIKASRQISALGAREEKFFSKSVTHIVTTRQIPPSPDAEASGIQSSTAKLPNASVQPGQRTINPSLLERSVDLQMITLQRAGRHGVELSSQRRSQMVYQENEVRRSQTSNADVLHKGREMNMKIWALEKFERMMSTLFDIDPNTPEAAELQPSRKIATVVPTVKQEPALSQLLRDEKNMPADRTPWSDIVPFRGIYIYIHDVTEKTKPVMVREYAKVSQKEEGEWPQFRSVPLPRCPFVEDTHCSKSDAEKQKMKEKEKRRIEEEARKAEQQQPRTRAASAAIEAAKCRTGTELLEKPVLRESENASNRMAKPTLLPPMSKTFEFDAPTTKPVANNSVDSMPPQLGSTRFNFPNLARPGKEPMASGVQQSNVTSAIKSQMISSTAAGPAGKAGTSKEMHQLQRRAVERRSGLSTTNMPSSYINDVRAAINTEQAPVQRRATRRTPAVPMMRIHEDRTISDDEEDNHTVTAKACVAPKKKRSPKKDLKPGYCENCRDKYDDFTEHIESRKHKKFAFTTENWTELDFLLRKLVRR